MEKKKLYNNATGVIKGFRNQGLTQQMYNFILPSLKKDNIRSIQLEVLDNNVAAIKAYKKVGFKKRRERHCYKGSVTIDTWSKDIIVKPLLDYDWQLFFTFWDLQPSWQNSI